MEFSTISSEGYRYIALATDEYSPDAFAKPITHKHQAYTCIRTLQQRIHSRTGRKLEYLRDDQEFFLNVPRQNVLLTDDTQSFDL
jgi:hypothetical protein